MRYNIYYLIPSDNDIGKSLTAPLDRGALAEPKDLVISARKWSLVFDATDREAEI